MRAILPASRRPGRGDQLLRGSIMAGRLNLAALRGRSGGAGFLEAAQPSFSGIPFPPPIPLPGTLGVVRRPGSIGFTLNGSLGWLIDVRRFAGAPTLTVRSIAQG